MTWDKGASILNAVKAGNNEMVLDHLYKDILPKIKKLILRNSGTEDDAKDIFQDTVLIFYNQVKQNKFDESKDIAGFMYSVARNLWINKVKKDNRLVQITDTEPIEVSEESFLNDMISKEKAFVIEELMNKIGDECKKLLIYSVYEKLSMKEIAEKMGYKNEGIAKTYNYRCKQKIVNLVKNNQNIISLFKE